jgi:hypothetical protein
MVFEMVLNARQIADAAITEIGYYNMRISIRASSIRNCE